MDTKALRQKILDLAIHGRLVPQDPNDEPASVLLQRINPKAEITPDNEQYGKMPKGWCRCKLKDVGSFESGYAFSSDEYQNTGTPLVRISNITNNGTIDLSSCVFINDDNISKFLVYKGDLLIAMSGATTGKMGVYQYKTEALLNQRVGNLKCSNAWDKQYRNYFMLAKSDYIFKIAYGGAQPNISAKAILNIGISLPPLKEQRRIVAEIERWFSLIDIIESGKASLQTAVKQAKAKILDLAIHGKLVPQDPADEPACELLHRINPNAEITSDNDQYGKVPRGWANVQVGDYVKTVTDFVASGSFATLRDNVKYYNSPNYAILVRTKDFQNNFTKDLVYTDKHGYEFLEKSNLFGGELIFSNVGSVGKVFIVPQIESKMTLAPNSIMVRFNKEEHQKWFYYLFISQHGLELLLSITSATAVGKFNKTDFKKLTIPIPPLSEQHRIVSKIEELFARLDLIEAEL